MHCTDGVTVAAYRCIEEDKFSKNASVAWSPYRFLKRWQSVFPLFIGFNCSVIVVFCRCLYTCLWSLCWRRCRRSAKRLSLCFAVFYCRRLLRSRWILVGVLQRSFGAKSLLATFSSHLLCLLFCVIGMGNCSWFIWALHEYNMKMCPWLSAAKSTLPSCLETQNAPWPNATWRHRRAPSIYS